ncbi:MAG: AraC family transcriptional regulator [Pseudomonadales bacterium]|nr:AraC family transcriptional regulator [Pseudomonadales bacterium]
MEDEYFVASELSLLVLRYLNEEALSVPAIRRKLLAYPRGSRMPIRIWWEVLDELAAEVKHPDLGFEIGQRAELFHTGVLGYMIAQNETVHDALICFQRYQSLLHDYGPLVLEEKDHLLHVRWDYLGKQSTLTSDKVFVSSFIAVAKKLAGGLQLAPAQVRFQQPQDIAGANTEERLGCSVVFGAESLEVSVNSAILALNLHTQDPYILEIMDRQAQALWSDANKQNNLLLTVENTIVNALSSGHPDADSVAQRLNMSRRTLHRRLKDNGLNFHEALRNVRIKLAQLYLADNQLSLNEVAFLLGYSEQSAFNRAFRSWFGQSPGQYRTKTF